MTPTTEAELHDLFVTTIRGMAPRVTYGNDRWEPYERANETPSRSRRFRLIWSNIGIRQGGIFTTKVYEYESVLTVQTDYMGDRNKTQWMVTDDHVHLLETLLALKAPDTGLMLVTSSGTTYDYGDDDEDAVRVDHSYNIRFLRSRE